MILEVPENQKSKIINLAKRSHEHLENKNSCE